MLAAFATNPGSIAAYVALGVIAFVMVVLAVWCWTPDSSGTSARPWSVLAGIIAVACVVTIFQIGFGKGNEQEQAADAAHQTAKETDYITQVATKRFGDYFKSVDAANSSILLEINDKVCAVRVMLGYEETESDYTTFWLNTGGNVREAVIDGDDLYHKLCQKP